MVKYTPLKSAKPGLRNEIHIRLVHSLHLHPQPSSQLRVPACFFFLEAKGPMSDLAKRMEDYLRISCTLAFLCFLPGTDLDQDRGRCSESSFILNTHSVIK